MPPTSPTDREMAIAVRDGDWTRCGACGTRIALGIAPVREGARLPCKSCGTWNRLTVPEAVE